MTEETPEEQDARIDAMLKNMLTEEMQNSSLRDAVKTVTEMSGQPRRKIYQLAIELDM